jgi:hypothetical protein
MRMLDKARKVPVLLPLIVAIPVAVFRFISEGLAALDRAAAHARALAGVAV